MPLKDSTETKMGCQERRRGRMGGWSDRSLNNPITTLLFFFGKVQKYYDGSVALYIYFVCDSAIPKFLFFSKKRKKKIVFFFRTLLFYNINIVNSLWCEKKKSL